MRAQNQRRLETQTQARLQALQARIRPHFMFNALNTTASLTRSRPEVAEEMVEDLAELLRASLAEAARPSTWPRSSSWRSYLRMEALRMGERLRYRVRCEEGAAVAPVPSLIVQPLVENAVYHGNRAAAGGGRSAHRERQPGGEVTVTVSNPKARAASPRRRETTWRWRISASACACNGSHARVEVIDGEESFRVNLVFPLRSPA